jgi:hypothetical protein
LSCLSFLGCADSIDTAPPPSVLLASFSYIALLPSTGDGPLSCVPLSGNQLHAPELGPPLGGAWSRSPTEARGTPIPIADLRGICDRISPITDSGGIRHTLSHITILGVIHSTIFPRADPGLVVLSSFLPILMRSVIESVLLPISVNSASNPTLRLIP